jgi:hypothetical protein
MHHFPADNIFPNLETNQGASMQEPGTPVYRQLHQRQHMFLSISFYRIYMQIQALSPSKSLRGKYTDPAPSGKDQNPGGFVRVQIHPSKQTRFVHLLM